MFTAIRMLVVMGFVALMGTTPSHAAAKEFDFKDPKGVNSIVFVLDSLLEPIMGVGSGITGKVTFDPDNPKATKGKITLDAKTLQTPNGGMADKMKESDWLDVESNPTITFEVKEVKEVKRGENDSYELTAVGELTCKGVTKSVTTVVSATYLPGKLGDRMRGANGDLLVLRSNFIVKRSDFQIKPEMGPEVVAEDIEVRVSIAGGHKAD